MSTRSRSKNWVVPLALAVSAAGAGLYLYNKITPMLSLSGEEAVKSKARPNRISLVVSKSLVESGLPLGQLLARFAELVIIVTPNGLSQQLKAQIPADQKYRVIPCETQVGIVHVLKHLRSELVVLPGDVPQTVSSDIQRFVGSITVLSNDAGQASMEIQDLFF